MIPDEVIIDEVFSGITKVPEHNDEYTSKMKTIRNSEAWRELRETIDMYLKVQNDLKVKQTWSIYSNLQAIKFKLSNRNSFHK